MAAAKKGDTVAVHYTGTLTDGEQFDSSQGREPLEFELGAGQVVPGFDAAVMGLEEGETVTKTIPHAEAYGAIREDLKVQVPREQMPKGMDLTVGAQVRVSSASGEQMRMSIAEVGLETVTLDANHPLAGKDLTFEIELVEIKG